jgi:hypothetical protein
VSSRVPGGGSGALAAVESRVKASVAVGNGAEVPNEDIDAVERMDDPAARARAATELLSRYQAAVNRLARIRRRAIAELRAAGLSYAQVGEALGVTRGRVAQLRLAANVVEQAFFGGAAVTIATPLRTVEAGRPVIAQEDFEAAMALVRFLDGIDIETSLAQVAPDGTIDFGPDALVVICGPKSSPVVADLIAADPGLDFLPDESGRWVVTERASGRVFSSPIDAELPADEDYAYVARLRRPDGRPFILIAGIHAVGSLGAAHYLTQPANVHALQADVGSHLFSAVVHSAFTRPPLAVTASDLALPPVVHDNQGDDERPTSSDA